MPTLLADEPETPFVRFFVNITVLCVVPPFRHYFHIVPFIYMVLVHWGNKVMCKDYYWESSFFSPVFDSQKTALNDPSLLTLLSAGVNAPETVECAFFSQ